MKELKQNEELTAILNQEFENSKDNGFLGMYATLIYGGYDNDEVLSKTPDEFLHTYYSFIKENNNTTEITLFLNDYPQAKYWN